MNDEPFITIAVEGELDEVVLKKIVGLWEAEVTNVYGKRGKGYLQKNISRYNKAAEYGKWILTWNLNVHHC
jgi:hypothetical protein